MNSLQKTKRKIEIQEQIEALQDEYQELDKYVEPLRFGDTDNGIFVEEDTETYNFPTFVVGANFNPDPKNRNSGQFRTTIGGLRTTIDLLTCMLNTVNSR